MKSILKPIFEIITGEYILFENIFQNYIAMSIIGTIAYLIAKKVVGLLYREHIIEGKTIGSFIHWTVRLIVFLGVFYGLVGIIWLTKFISTYKNIILFSMIIIVISTIVYKIIKKYNLIIKVNWKKIFMFMLKVLSILGVIFIFLSIFIFMPIVLKWGITLLIDYKIISQSYDQSILNFYATVIGGLLTLVGVWMTIKHENEIKKEEDLIKYKPILEVCGMNESQTCALREVKLGMPFYSSNNDEKKEEKHEKFYRDLEDNTTYRILIQNKGRGETFGAVLNRFEFKETNWDKDNTLLCSAVSENQYIGEILKDGYLGIDVKLPNYMFMPEKQEGLLWYELRTNIIISYSDMFNKNKYQYELYLISKVLVKKIEEEQPYFYKDNFKYSKVKYDSIQIMPVKKIYSKKRKEYITISEYMREKS